MRCRAISTLSASFSMPTNRNPSQMQAMPVEPLPIHCWAVEHDGVRWCDKSDKPTHQLTRLHCGVFIIYTAVDGALFT